MTLPSNAATDSPAMPALRPRRGSAFPLLAPLRLLHRKPLGAVSAAVIAVIGFTALFAPVIAPYDPAETHPRGKLQGPSAKYRLGTDDLGRDAFSRIVHGARTSLFAGVTA